MFLRENLACFPFLSVAVFHLSLCFYSLQLRAFWRVFVPLFLCVSFFCNSIPCRCSCVSFGVFSVPLFLCVSCHNQPSHSPIVLPPTCQPRQISGKKSFQQKSLAHFSPWETASAIRPALKRCKHSVWIYYLNLQWIAFCFLNLNLIQKRKSIEQKNFQLLRQYCLLFHCLANFFRPHTFLTIPIQFLWVKYNVCPITKNTMKKRGWKAVP